ncbi:MAG: serine/threonine protein kinase [Gemmataceae bacterium]|nr:serine/threonine protein kinase [Gemmataceae bacterium]
MIAVSCVSCGKSMTLSEGGRRAECPECRQSLPLKRRALHELPTRVDCGMPDSSLTAFLAPPRAPGELGWLGGYRILEIVGSGGMGVVFRAVDTDLDREIALKAMLPGLATHATARLRFVREAKAAAALQHDRIVAVYRVGEDRGVPFLAMPFLRGQSLEDRLKDGPLPLEEVRRVGAEIAEGLAAIHERGLVHRDIKPGNVWLEGPAARVKILDFGLARAGGDATLTREGGIVGSPAFMSPEQALRRPVDSRADLFALGVVLYLMATGQPPFLGDDALSTLLAITSAEPAPPSSLRADLPPDLEGMILVLLAKNPEDRPASAADVWRRLG